MARLRYPNPPRDLSHWVPEARERPELTNNEKQQRAQDRADSIDTRPIPSRAEKQAQKEEAERLYLATHPSRLIKAQEKKSRTAKRRKR